MPAGSELPAILRPDVKPGMVVEVFTSLYRYRASKGTMGRASRVGAHFGNLLRHWPDPNWDAGGPDLVRSSASPVSITLTADEVRVFAHV